MVSVSRAVFVIALLVTVAATLNFVVMAAGPGPKFNCFALLQKRCGFGRGAMNAVYLGVGFAALALLVLSVGMLHESAA